MFKGCKGVTDEASYAKSLEGLDKFQSEAVTSDAGNVLLRAPAGSGKTKSVIAAIAAYRYEHLNDRICAITYTRAARAEMEARLQELGVRDVEVTTIHVWSRNLLNDLSIKYDFKIKILEESQIKGILEEIVDEYIKRSKVKKINIGILYTYITGSKNMDITDNYRRTLNALESRYIHYKRDNGLYDFTDYPLYLFNVLETFDESINNIDALFVDEFQDVDEVQLEIFKKVNASKKFYVGDA
jgi:superfamily I DNA/RNA helicase